MFYHVKDLQFNARVSQPDPRFARVMLEAFGGANGELKSALQYFVQAFSCHNPYPDKYDMLMDIATEEFGHLEIVGATIQMYNPQIQISAESETKRSIFRKRDKTKRSKKESAQHSKSRNKSFVMTSVSAL